MCIFLNASFTIFSIVYLWMEERWFTETEKRGSHFVEGNKQAKDNHVKYPFNITKWYVNRKEAVSQGKERAFPDGSQWEKQQSNS